MTIINNANKVMYNLYWDRVINNGKTVTRLAKLAPAPRATKIAGKAQHIKVDEDANNEKKFDALSFIFTKFLIFAYQTYFGHLKEFSFQFQKKESLLF